MAKEAAEMVLADDNYASIVAAIEQGRVVYDNIRKFVYYLLSCNVAEILVLFVGILAGWPPVLEAVQLLWLNLITDGAPALALAGNWQVAALLLIAERTGKAIRTPARELEPLAVRVDTRGFAPVFWLYLLAAALLAADFADFPLIAFHFERAAVVSVAWIPLFYAVAMGVDALAALLLGWLFDRVGRLVLVGSTLLAALFAPLVFTGGFYTALAGMVLWGVGMAAQESVLRAVVADLSPADRRGAAFGLFNTGYDLAWFLGSALSGVLYDRSIVILVTFAVVVQVAAALVFVLVHKDRRQL